VNVDMMCWAQWNQILRIIVGVILVHMMYSHYLVFSTHYTLHLVVKFCNRSVSSTLPVAVIRPTSEVSIGARMRTCHAFTRKLLSTYRTIFVIAWIVTTSTRMFFQVRSTDMFVAINALNFLRRRCGGSECIRVFSIWI
jgi:hypothetical protein